MLHIKLTPITTPRKSTIAHSKKKGCVWEETKVTELWTGFLGVSSQALRIYLLQIHSLAISLHLIYQPITFFLHPFGLSLEHLELVVNLHCKINHPFQHPSRLTFPHTQEGGDGA